MKPPIERVSSAATRSLHKRFAPITNNLIELKAAQARVNARRREIHSFQATDDDALHRMLNAMQLDTYVRPHRHVHPPKDEAVIVLKGVLGVIVFDDTGQTEPSKWVCAAAGSDTIGVDLRAGTWHTFVALQHDTVMFEVKPGPYTPISDKDFAPWAPAAENEDAVDYLRDLESRFRNHFHLPGRKYGSSSA